MPTRDRLPDGQPGHASDSTPLTDPAPLTGAVPRSAPRPTVTDTDLAPLGIPAVVLGIALITAGILAVPALDDWTAAYGPLVTVAFVGLVIAAVGCCRWGWTTARTQK